MRAEASIAVAAVVVTYRPREDVLERLLNYAEWFEHVIVVDNTESSPALQVLEGQSNLSYLPLLCNTGVAKALNIGIRMAIERGHRHILLLDQDSAVLENSVKRLIQCVDPTIAIVGMRPVAGDGDCQPETSGPQATVVDVAVAITSGSLLSASAYEACGPIDERLFIDYVDFDYCLRLRRGGWRLVECPGAPMPHSLGEGRKFQRLGVRFCYVSHSPLRSYYRVRNGLHVLSTHGTVFPQVAVGILRVMIKETLKALFIEDHRRERLTFMVRGACDWLWNRYGSFKST